MKWLTRGFELYLPVWVWLILGVGFVLQVLAGTLLLVEWVIG